MKIGVYRIGKTWVFRCPYCGQEHGIHPESLMAHTLKKHNEMKLTRIQTDATFVCCGCVKELITVVIETPLMKLAKRFA